MEELIWPSLLLLLGLGLLVAEVFLPAGGLLGLLAFACLATSFYSVQSVSTAMGLRWILLEAVAVPGAWLGAIYGLPRTRLGRRIFLRPPEIGELAELEINASAVDRVGSSGRALTPLRPSGIIDVEGRRVEAMAESGLIAVGTRVTVVAIRSGRAVVREG